MRKFLPIAIAVLGAGLTPAYVASITETYNFSLGGFVDINASPQVAPPVTTITGSFTVTFDPSLNYDNDTTDLTVNSFSGIGVPLDSSLGFTYDASGHFFFLGGTENDSDFVLTGTNDFVLTFDLTNPSQPQFVPCDTPGFSCGAETGNSQYDTSGYTRSGGNFGNSLWFIAAAQSNPAVPEPSTWMLMCAGFAAVGFVSMRQARKAPDSSDLPQ